MNVLVVYAHPNPKSFNAAILLQVERGLHEGGHTFTVVHLYKDNFNPVLVAHATFRRKDHPETAYYRELLQWADHLIFIYPVWWSGTPAILKGFFERVLSSGFAYTYEVVVPKGLLRGKSAWVFYTMDSPRWFVRVFRQNAEWIAIRDATLKFCGVRPVRRFVFAEVKRSAERRREQWLNRVYRQVRYGLE